MPTASPYLELAGIEKTFGSFRALTGVSLGIDAGKFVCFLGPSGCGKTTLLRIIAGLDPQSAGSVRLAGRDVSYLPAAARDYGIVFQSYALFPNLTVAKNVAYGIAAMARPARDARVAEMLALVGLPDAGGKYPAQLSGGQQQRVALARALAPSPGLLLLDEPLSALDARVRLHLRTQIRELHDRLGITTVMVTHDQEEALTMADEIVVMNHGVIEQVGTPQDIYHRPATRFVASFVGTMNFLSGTLTGPNTVRLGSVDITCESDPATAGLDAGHPVTVCLRPEDVVIRSPHGDNMLSATVDHMEFLGSVHRARLKIQGFNGHVLTADMSANLVRDLGLRMGSDLPVALPAERLRVYPAART